jgi:hypothetical protein
MHRRSALGHLAGTFVGLSLGQAPSLSAETLVAGEPFLVDDGNLPDSVGLVTCPGCQEIADSLSFTPAGVCLRCADRNPGLRAVPHSDTFWALSPRQVRRLESEINGLATKLDRMNSRFVELRQRQLSHGGDGYHRAIEGGREEWLAMQRELHLLQMLRAASRQLGETV